MINGQLKGSDKQYHGINPFTEQTLWPAPVATEEDLDAAVKAANAAFKQWKKTGLEERRSRFKEYADALLAQRDEWAELISKEAGQSVSALFRLTAGNYHNELESI